MNCDTNGMKLFYLSAKVRTSVPQYPRLASTVKEIWFAEVKERSHEYDLGAVFQSPIKLILDKREL